MWCVLTRIASSGRGDSNKYTQYTIFNIKITLSYPKSAIIGFFQWTQERNSRGKGDVSVRATEGQYTTGISSQAF